MKTIHVTAVFCLAAAFVAAQDRTPTEEKAFTHSVGATLVMVDAENKTVKFTNDEGATFTLPATDAALGRVKAFKPGDHLKLIYHVDTQGLMNVTDAGACDCKVKKCSKRHHCENCECVEDEGQKAKPHAGQKSGALAPLGDRAAA
jgi:hypothetical protein